MKVIVTTADDIRELFRECLREERSTKNVLDNSPPEKEYVKSIQEIADLFGTSLTTAQRIKNHIPKSMYFQCGRTFSISKDFLLTEYPKLIKNRRGSK